MSTKLRWLSGGCLEIVLPSGKVLVTDPSIDISWNSPIKCQEVTGADYIFITHDCWAAVSDVGPLVQRFNSKVICSHQLAEPLRNFFNLDESDVIRVTAGNTIVFDDLKVEVKKAYALSVLQSYRVAYRVSFGKESSPSMSLAELQEALPHPMMTPAVVEMRKNLEAAGIGHHGEQLNFVFQTSDNLRIYYHSQGIHEFLRQEIVQAHPNVFITELGGNDPEKIAEFAALSCAEVVIPTHHGARGPEMQQKLAEWMAKRLAERSTACFANLVRGKWYEIGVEMSAI